MQKPHIPTTEELTLRKIEEEKERLRRQIEENRENMKKVISGTDAMLPVHSTKPLTTPEEPYFRLDAKYPPRNPDHRSPPKAAPVVYRQQGEVTKPEPFAFHTTSRGQFHVTDSPEPASPFVPLCNRVAKFEQSLREPAMDMSVDEDDVRHEAPLTHAQSPVLLTKLRRKNSTVQRSAPSPLEWFFWTAKLIFFFPSFSTQDREIQEIENAPKFRAREIDRRV